MNAILSRYVTNKTQTFYHCVGVLGATAFVGFLQSTYNFCSWYSFIIQIKK